MEHNNQNKYIREQLNEINSFPDGINFNSELAWQKIENSLQPKQQKKVTGWYFAAASILLICMFFFGINKQKTLNKVTDETQKIKGFPALKAKPVNALVTLNKNPADKNLIENEVKKLSGIKKNKGHIITQQNYLTVVNQQYSAQKITVKMFTVTKDTLINSNKNIALNTLVENKKKFKPALKVLHINELGEATNILDEQEKNKQNTTWFFPKKNQFPDISNQQSPRSKTSIFTLTLSSKNQ